MKLRHAAALALVGWYLMMPHRPGDPGEPFSKWYQSEEFDTETECNDLLEYDRSLYLGYFGKRARTNAVREQNQGHERAVQEQIHRLRYAECVDANDPPLNPK